MPPDDFRSPRLHIDAPMAPGAALPLDRNQSNYLGNVLRLAAGQSVLVFNGRDGEWRGTIAGRKRPESLVIETRTRPQTEAADVHYVFAPLKHARLDYMVQKAVEMGAARLRPVITRHTQVARVNSERMRANIVEAAEQCGILTIAANDAPIPFDRFLSTRNPDRLLIFCDEAAAVGSAIEVLQRRRADARNGIDVLVGPEGGFAGEERAALQKQPRLARISLGPRILRADTAAVAALALVGAAFFSGDGTD